MGNVAESSVLELWNHDRMVALRRMQVEERHGESDLCRDCAYLWGKSPGTVLGDARGMLKQSIRERLPAVARALGMRRWGVRDWNA